MGTEVLTDEKIASLLRLSKTVRNPSARKKVKGLHEQINYNVDSDDGETHFELFVRQNLKIQDDFSCGLLWLLPSGETVTLVRYNGSGHRHRNPIENQSFEYQCHVHRASERYVTTNKKPETFAEPTDRYQTLNGALDCLLCDCNISGLNVEPEDRNLNLKL